jgi:hypothetical protein
LGFFLKKLFSFVKYKMSDDPFGDIPGVKVVSESEGSGTGMLVDLGEDTGHLGGGGASASSSSSSKKKKARASSAASPFASRKESEANAIRSMSKTYPKSFQQKAERDLEERIQFEKSIHSKLQELHAVRERLYQLRFDTERPREAVARDVQNHIKELGRLEALLTKLRQQSLRRFTRSLALDEIGLEAGTLLNSTVLGKDPGSSVKTIPARMSISAAAAPSASSSSAAGANGDPDDSSESYDDDDADGVYSSQRAAALVNEPLMRTKSTQTLKDKPPSEKWAGLFRMFREWKHQKQVAEATHILGRKETMLDEEIAKLRAAVFTLKQKKQLSPSDRQLLAILTKKLEALNNMQ